MPPRSRGIVTLAVWGDEGLFSCFLWLPGLFECVQTRFEDSPGRKKPRKNQKMTIKILGENPKWCLGVAATSHTLCALCAEDVRREAERSCEDVNERCGAVAPQELPLIVGGGRICEQNASQSARVQRKRRDVS